MDLREAKALEIAARMKLVYKDGTWTVPSQSGQGSYKVTLGAKPTCTCDDWTLRQQDCKHIIAARLVAERDGGATAPAVDTDVIPKKKSYKQNWPLYNAAQMNEKHRFLDLLGELCRGLSQPEYRGGRPRTFVGDILFACAYKVYSGFSSRRFTCDLKDAHAAGHVGHAIHPCKLNNYMEDEALTPILSDLIIRSSLPLAAVETTFAPDSSGFSTSRFVRWYDEKYGVTRTSHDWVKCHIMTGTRTNIVTAVRIEDRNAADCPQFVPLLETTAKHFKIEEVSADKAYSSYENTNAVFAAGGTPFIAYKANATARDGGYFEKMLLFYQYRREEFLTHYHKRSNVESTFSMVKAKFRDNVRSRTPVAMRNETLCKFLCHNLCVLIASHYELGIEAEFWPGENKAVEGPMILKMRG